MVGVGLVGFGYWGPNLARNFSALPQYNLEAICESDPDRAQLAAELYPHSQVTAEYQQLLDNDQIQAVLIATPVGSHYSLAKQALMAGKDVLVEKPLVDRFARGQELVELAKQKDRILAVDHTFLFTGAVRKIKEIVDSGDLGGLLYYDSVRINLGLFQPDVNVIYDLAPHDISILCHLYPGEPEWVQAMGARNEMVGLEHHAYVHLAYAQGFMAHLHLSWLAPMKIRRTIIGGANKMLLYDDLNPSERVKIYDKGVLVTADTKDSQYAAMIEYRTGDMLAPQIDQTEALKLEAQHLLDCFQNRKQPLASGEDGLLVVKILEACKTSLQEDGRRVDLAEIS